MAPRSTPIAALAPATEATFRTAARLRGARAFHPRGTTFGARAQIPARGAPPGFPSGDHDALVRFSRGAGLPDLLPDVLGIGLRLVDAVGPGDHQDLLLATSWDAVVGRRLLRPTRSFTSGPFSTVLAYEVAGERVLFGARVLGDGPVGLADLVRPPGSAGGAERPGVALYWATLLGPWRPLGTVVVGDPLDEAADRALALDPFRTAPTVVPVGWLNELRKPAYAASQDGRPG